MTMDVTKAIEPRSDQQNADDYMTGPKTVRIESVEVKNTPEQPVWVHLDGHKGKPWKPSKTALRCLAAIWGPDASKWAGLSLTLYADPDVTWDGVKVGGIRVSHMEGLDAPRTLMLTKTRGKKGASVIKPLVIEKQVKGKPEPTEPAADIDKPALFADAKDNAALGRKKFGAWYKTKSPAEHEAMKEISADITKLLDDATADAPAG